jgi:hypothetical protein
MAATELDQANPKMLAFIKSYVGSDLISRLHTYAAPKRVHALIFSANWIHQIPYPFYVYVPIIFLESASDENL